MSTILHRAIASIASLLVMATCLGAASDADLVLVGGRVMDPESGLDAVRTVVIREGRIADVTGDRPRGENVVDVSGLVVAPGFIDLHAHGQDGVSNRFQAADGVTTAMDLEIGYHPIDTFYASRAGDALIHYGATVSHPVARYAAMTGARPEDITNYRDAAFGSPTARAAATPEQLKEVQRLLALGLEQGALGIGYGITYTPGASHAEILDGFETAARYGAPVFVHVRSSSKLGGDRIAPLQEVLANAAATGGALHIVHINSSTGESVRDAMRLIRAARANDVDVTTEAYPYTAGSTLIESALFDDWAGDYGNLQWAATGERLTEATFRRYREQGGWVIIHGRSETTNEWITAQPDIIAASDGISFLGGPAHPRGAGCYSKILGYYVRERGALDLMTALKKMTLMPAQRLEAIAPQMKRKGRVQVGADADLTLFDPQKVRDRATYEDSMQYATGIEHVLVAGTFVVRDGKLVEGVAPGRPVWGRHRRSD